MDGPEGITPLIRYTILDASERRSYERELLDAKREAEAALARVRQLETLLPVSSWCRKIHSTFSLPQHASQTLQYDR